MVQVQLPRGERGVSEPGRESRHGNHQATASGCGGGSTARRGLAGPSLTRGTQQKGRGPPAQLQPIRGAHRWRHWGNHGPMRKFRAAGAGQ